MMEKESSSVSSEVEGRSTSSTTSSGGGRKRRREVVRLKEYFLGLMVGGSLRVLLLEGDDSTRHIIAALLRKCNYKEIATNRSVSTNINSLSMLNGTNFKKWKEDVLIVLGCMDLDYALQAESPPPLMAESTSDQKRDFKKLERSNRSSLMIMRHAILETFRDTASECQNAKAFLATLESRFAKSEKAETSTLINKLVFMKYKGNKSIREYILEMEQIASKLKALKLVIPKDLLVHLVSISSFSIWSSSSEL